MSKPITVEINLRVPSLRGAPKEEGRRMIVNSEVRFIKTIDVDALPRPGDTLELSTRAGHRVPVTVKRLDWFDDKDRFVVGCQYAERSITTEVYDSLKVDPDWETRPLL